jgi:hypothetical protein
MVTQGGRGVELVGDHVISSFRVDTRSFNGAVGGKSCTGYARLGPRRGGVMTDKVCSKRCGPRKAGLHMLEVGSRR